MPKFSAVNKEDRLFTEMALRLVGFGRDGIPFSFGTAFVIRPYLLVTARHVVEEFISNSHLTEKNNELEITFWAIQIEWVAGEHGCNIWQVVNAYMSPHSDLCLLHLSAYNDTASKYQQWKTVPVSLIPPRIGEEVTAFGFHATKFNGSKFSEMGALEHLELNDTASRSVGNVKEIYMLRRDSVMLPFPCFEVDSQYEPGMSGGLVINSNGELCGIVCSSMPLDDGYCSHVAQIWPVLGIEVDFGGDSTELSGVFPLSKLVETGRWNPKGWENVQVEYIEGQRYPRVTFHGPEKV